MVRVRVTFLLYNVTISGSRTYQVLTRPRVGSLLFHMSVFLLAHVSCCGWITCHFFIGPCVVFLLVHMVVSYSSTWHGAILPRVVFLFGHVASRLSSTCRILIAHVSSPGYFTCHALVRPRVALLFDYVACPSSTAWSRINLS
jgi:hypothetical protein